MACSTRGLFISDLEVKTSFLQLELLFNPEVLETEIFKEWIYSAMGTISLQTYSKYPFFYVSTNYPTAQHNDLTKEEFGAVIGTASQYLDNIDNLIMCLWLIKDNSCNVSEFHTFIDTVEYLHVKQTGTLYTDYKGSFIGDTYFNMQELREAGDLFIKYTFLSHHNNLVKIESPDEVVGVISSKKNIKYNIRKVTRIEKGMHFLKYARSSQEIHLKISFYVCMFETLFCASNKIEVKHTISERIAMYQGGTKNKRKAIYKLVQEAYDIRSAYFHGNSLEGIKNIELICKGIDELARTILHDIITKDSLIFMQESGKLEMSFKDLIFANKKNDSLETEIDLSFQQFRNVDKVDDPNSSFN